MKAKWDKAVTGLTTPDEVEQLRAEVEALKKPDCRVCKYWLDCKIDRSNHRHQTCVNGSLFDAGTPTPLWRTEP